MGEINKTRFTVHVPYQLASLTSMKTSRPKVGSLHWMLRRPFLGEGLRAAQLAQSPFFGSLRRGVVPLYVRLFVNVSLRG